LNVSGYQQYRLVQFQTASPGDLVLMLYDGAIRFVSRAETALERDNPAAARNSVLRAQAILQELMSSLRQDEAEISAPLMSLYAYMHRRLVEANIRRDSGSLREVCGLLERLRDAWQQAVCTTAAGANVQQGTTVALSPQV
jgi:flagellar protein FliS